MQVCFVALPFQNIENPVLSLSILKSCLNKANIDSKIIYANIDFAELIGLQAYYTIVHSGGFREALLGDFVFSSMAFSDSAKEKSYFDFLKKELCAFYSEEEIKSLLENIQKAISNTELFLEQTVQKVLQSNPAVVACSSVTQQNCVSIAFFKKLKEKAPQIITVLGGPNCERIMGKTIAENFDNIDYVISGEADSFWADFCRKILNGQRCFPEYPYVFTKNKVNDANQAGFTENLDEIAFPDFDDYFTSLDSFIYKKYVNPALLIETSRGCWWGEKHPCTFCGMNGASRIYREKSSERIFTEFKVLAEKYKIKNFFAVDCILSFSFLSNDITKLNNLNLNIMYEIKTNVTLQQIRKLKDAGITWVQPGIESLQDDLLKLMNKGNRAIKHAELLKRLTEEGIMCCWILMCAFPEENDDWYSEQLDTLKLLTHLQPPDAVFRLRYDRFSTYEQNEEQYKLNLLPAPAYYYLYPSNKHNILRNLAYFFIDKNNPQPLYGQGFTKAIHKETYNFVKEWQKSFWSPFKERLLAKITDSGMEILDLRACAETSFYKLTDCENRIAIETINVISDVELKQKLKDCYQSAEIDKAVCELKRKKLLLHINNEFLFLPLVKVEMLPDKNLPPAGSIICRGLNII